MWLIPYVTLEEITNDEEFLPKRVSRRLSRRSSTNRLSVNDLNLLQQELEKSIPRYKTHYRKQVYDFQPGDRVIYDGRNYSVTKVLSKTEVSLQEVDMLGNVIVDSPIVNAKLKLDKGNQKWSWKAGGVEIEYGIVRYPNGPRINTIEDL